ncbi:MAG: alpha/beta fold hydrolase [Methanomicrobiaceae archaeon]|nr:alpha/beta fold hydrolase [Methanomicrobiaceae archaeon]
MTSYVLIHGGHNDSSVWEKVVPYLKCAGYNVFAPTLADPKETTLNGHISEVCEVIEKIRSEKIILAGHSYGAMVITGVCARIPERIIRIIYLDSAVPKSGDSLYGIMERCGAPYQTFGLTPERPFTDPLIFDEGIIRKIPKTYVHCTNSEFIAVGKCAYEDVRKNRERDNWVCYELKSPHNCMKAMPEKVADILLLR